MKQRIVLCKMVMCLFLCLMLPVTYAAKLALVIDDFGYREHNDEQVILLSPQITVAVLPNTPNAAHIARLAHQNGNDVIVHLPMAPISKQPLEINTLAPSMSVEEIHRIIGQSIEKVPYAIGINNHMGSLMTTDLVGMEKVMKSLSHYSLFFLDSKTIATSKGILAAKKYRVSTIVRDIFLDDAQNEAAITHQFNLAVKHAQKYGSAVAIGHPYGPTVKVLKEKLAQLPADIELVKVSTLVQKPEKIKLFDLFEQYKIDIEQSVFEYMIIKKSQ